MRSVLDTPLAERLARITSLDAEIKEVDRKLAELKALRLAIAKLAADDMLNERLDGVRASGRSWRVEWDHHLSVGAERQDAVMEAARQIGRDDALVTVSTTKLKSLLREMATEAGKDARRPFAEGTVFEGLVGEYVEPVLRHQSAKE